MLQVLREQRVLHEVVLVRRIGEDVGPLRRNGPELHHEGVEVALLLLGVEVVEGAVAAAGAVEELPAPADEAVRQVQPEILRVPADLAPPVLGVRADLLGRRQLHQVLEVLGFLDVLVRLVAGRLLHGPRALVRDDGLAHRGHKHRQVLGGIRQGLLRAAGADGEQRVLLDDLPLVLQQHPDGLRRLGPALALRLLLLLAVEPLLEVEAAGPAVALHVEVNDVGPEAIPRLQVHEQPLRGEGGIEGEDALVLVDFVVVLRLLDPRHQRPDCLHGALSAVAAPRLPAKARAACWHALCNKLRRRST
mmetsp:Transcript_67027/g.187407  ORF Transcript_67027/g.187407 Transcript_67027/m.187407 type:complete len:305 (-) Transcript_67027:45-959(-)